MCVRQFVRPDLSDLYLAHSFLEGLLNDLVQMFTMIGWCVAHKANVRRSKAKVTLGGQRKRRVLNVTSTCMEDF
jgi:hypothetical protein